VVLGTQDFKIPQVFVSVDAVETEVDRFRQAVSLVCDEIAENESLATEQLGKQYGAIFAAHLMMARDPKLLEEIETLIRDRCYSPEYASSRVLRRYAREFQNLGDRFLAERAVDLFDLEKRILRHLLGERREELAHLTTPVIVLAHDLTPSETWTSITRSASPPKPAVPPVTLQFWPVHWKSPRSWASAISWPKSPAANR